MPPRPSCAPALASACAALILNACSLLVDTGGLSGGSNPDAAEAAPVDGSSHAPVDGAGPDGAPHESDASDDGDATVASDAPDAMEAGPGPAEGGLSDSSTGDTGSDGADGSTCGRDLSNVGSADFHVALSVTTTQSGKTALVNQRAHCGHGVFWDLRLESGLLRFEMDDGTAPNYVGLSSGTPLVNDGHPHEVRVARTSGTLALSIDGVGSSSAADTTSLAQLAPLVIGTDPCEGDAGDGTVAFAGAITNVCLGSP